MERMGLVSQLERELERMIVSGMLPEEGGVLPSEQMLARHHGVSRATVREALLRLSARGLVVQHPGRRTRAVAVGQAVSLENLGMLLNGRGGLYPGGLRMLEGYFALKRDITVELLEACCEQASDREWDSLQGACFALREETRWRREDGGRWVALEFELLRQAAAAANRPDAYLLVQSLERAWLGIARRVAPLLDAEATGKWALCAFQALGARDARALRRELPPLLRADDERVLDQLAPPPVADSTPEAPLPAADSTPAADGTPAAPRTVTESSPVDTTPPRSEEGPDSNLPNRSGCQTGSASASPPSAPSTGSSTNGDGCPPESSVLGASESESGGAPGFAPELPREVTPTGAPFTPPSSVRACQTTTPQPPRASRERSSTGSSSADTLPPCSSSPP